MDVTMDMAPPAVYEATVQQAVSVAAPAAKAPEITPEAAEQQAAAGKKPTAESYTQEGLEKAIEKINKSISSFNRYMNISVHQKTHRIMVKVMDAESNEVIREIPPEKALDAFARALEIAGILLDERS